MIFGSQPTFFERIFILFYKFVVFAAIFALGFGYYLLRKGLKLKNPKKNEDELDQNGQISDASESLTGMAEMDDQSNQVEFDQEQAEKSADEDQEEEEEEDGARIEIKTKPIDIRQITIEQNGSHMSDAAKSNPSRYNDEEKLIAKQRIGKFIQRKL